MSEPLEWVGVVGLGSHLEDACDVVEWDKPDVE
jgi:hypothetical protein